MISIFYCIYTRISLAIQGLRWFMNQKSVSKKNQASVYNCFCHCAGNLCNLGFHAEAICFSNEFHMCGFSHTSVYIYVCMFVCTCVCVCMNKFAMLKRVTSLGCKSLICQQLKALRFRLMWTVKLLAKKN